MLKILSILKFLRKKRNKVKPKYMQLTIRFLKENGFMYPNVNNYQITYSLMVTVYCMYKIGEFDNWMSYLCGDKTQILEGARTYGRPWEIFRHSIYRTKYLKKKSTI